MVCSLATIQKSETFLMAGQRSFYNSIPRFELLKPVPNLVAHILLNIKKIT
jgi:hypothetical protein